MYCRFVLLLLLFSFELMAQPIACVSGEEQPVGRCGEVCILCDIDLLDRRQDPNIDLSYGVPGCDLAAGDIFGFVAMSERLVVRVSISACTDQNGDVEDYVFFGAYSDDGGTCFDDESGINLSFVFPCEDGNELSAMPQVIFDGQSKIFSSSALVLGSEYFIHFGGVETATCRYQVEVLEGSTALPELTRFELEASTPPCLGQTVTYFPLNHEPATRYVYTLNGDTISTTDTAHITYNTPGEYELCIDGENYCSQAEQNCYSFSVVDTEPFQAFVDLCPGECHELSADSAICKPGIYSLTFADRNGCDSLVEFLVTLREENSTDLTATICSGDTLSYQGERYSQPDRYSVVLMDQFGCDSTVNINLIVAACPLQGEADSQQVSCTDEDDGSFWFTLSSGQPPYRYDFRRLGGGASGSGTVALRGEITSVNGLPPGTYLIEVSDDFGSVGYMNTNIERPEPITLEYTLSNFNNYNVSCQGASDGTINVAGDGGTGALSFSWSSGLLMGNSQSNLIAGGYEVTVTDDNGCTITEFIELLEPPALELSYGAFPTECESLASGRISDVIVWGGAGTQVVELTSQGLLIPPSQYQNLPAGIYLLTASDENNCILTDSVTIKSASSPNINLIVADSLVLLGNSTSLTIAGDEIAEISWEPREGLDCLDCPNITITPLRTEYYWVRATSTDGCDTIAGVKITVQADRKVYLPTAFSPNEDGVNDRLRIYPGQEVEMIQEHVIYDRWGKQVYRASNLSPEGIQSGSWDGTVGGMAAPSGVYVWYATIIFVDGVKETLRGTVSLIR